MNKIFNYLKLKGLIGRNKAICWYFVVSFCLFGSVAEAPFWAMLLLLTNFINSVRLLGKVRLPDADKIDDEV